MAAAFPSANLVQVGLGGSFRQLLIDELFNVGAYPLHEVSNVTDTILHDISRAGHHGIFVGVSGFTRGVTFGLPEGALGMTFDGNGYAEVADDSTAGGALDNMSCAGGDIDLLFLCKDVPNDATNRCVASKQVTNSTGNGWHASIQNGAVEFYLKVAGVVVFSFQRGAISGATERLVHCCYESGLGTASILIDGVLSGAQVTGLGTQPAVTTATFRIGAFANGVAGDGNGLKGSFAYVSVTREGDSSLSVPMQAARSWTTLAAKDLRGVMPMRSRYGISGDSILDLVAKPGTMAFAFNNGVTNSARLQGYYTPGHTNCRSGFAIGAPARWGLTDPATGFTHYKGRGRITAVTPTPGEYREQYAAVTVTGWLDIPANTFLPVVPAQANIRSDQAIALALDESEGRSPAALSLSTGSSTFAYALDVGRRDSESLLAELARSAASERAIIYEKGDTSQGGTVKIEGRGDRQIATALAATFSSTMAGLDVRYSLDHLINVVKVLYTPRDVAAATTVLYSLSLGTDGQPIAQGQTVVFEGTYRDATVASQAIGGTAMVTPLAGTDFAFWTSSDGTGTDISANLKIKADLGGSGFRLEIYNGGGADGYLRLDSTTAFQIRGKAITHYTQAEVESRDGDSVRAFGPRAVTIELPYESNRDVAQSFAEFYLGLFKQQRPIPTSVEIHGWASSALLTQALAREPGDRIGLVEAMTGIDATQGYFINEVDLTYEPGRGKVTAKWALVPAAPAGAFVFDTSTFDGAAVLGI